MGQETTSRGGIISGHGKVLRGAAAAFGNNVLPLLREELETFNL